MGNGRDLAIVVQAAGQGTRMKSAHAKVLHELGGRPLRHVFAPALRAPFGSAATAMAASPRGLGLSYAGALLES